MPRILAVATILLVIFASCSQEKKSSLTTINILDGLKNEQEFRLSKIVDEVEYVKLETNPGCLLSWAIYLVGNKYIVAVQSYGPAQLYLFDRTGKYLRKIGAEGKGPLEYSSISTVVTDPEETYILVNDYQRNTIIMYDFTGQVIKSYDYQKALDGDVSDIVVKNPDEIFFRLDYPILEKKNFYLIRKMNRNFQQTDSLYPVTSSIRTGNGWAWGSSDFYLKDGAVQFRQFSFDTLYGESKGKMVPRFYLPVMADHLPGPYLVSGLHKQMYDYTSTLNLTELRDYLILYTRIAPNKGGMMIHDKSTGELMQLKKYPPCPPDTLGRRVFLNDIDGIMHPMNFMAENGMSVNSYQVIDLKEKLTGNCPEVSEVKYPAKREEFINLINSSKEDDNPILQIFHLKL